MVSTTANDTYTDQVFTTGLIMRSKEHVFVRGLLFQHSRQASLPCCTMLRGKKSRAFVELSQTWVRCLVGDEVIHLSRPEQLTIK